MSMASFLWHMQYNDGKRPNNVGVHRWEGMLVWYMNNIAKCGI